MKQLVVLVLVIAAVSYGSQRVVVAEEFTATWCQYCPGAARALDEIYHRGYDTLVVIAYHSSSSNDSFYTAEAAARATYYSLSGYPTSWFDGTLSEVGGLHYGTMYPFFRHHITTRDTISSPLEIMLTCNYDTVANTGLVSALITNTSTGSISGTLHFVIVENDKQVSWQGMTKLDFLMRDMLPDANGEAVTIPASNNITRSRNFTANSGWNEKNCKIVVFVQASSREIYQGAEIPLVPAVNMDYYGLTFVETSGNNNRIAQPGEAISAYIMGKNNGGGTYSGGATITTSDPYITITSQNPQSVSVASGDVDTVMIVNFNISPSCPSPRTVPFFLNFGSPGDTVTFSYIVTNTPGFSDNIESGQGSWTHGGIRDNWHITEHKSHSTTHSWYCGVENTWQYTNENDASLVTSYFVATPDSSLKFWHQYALEVDWDFSYIEVDDGSGFWKTLGELNGTQSSWIQTEYSLASYAGQTIRIRFRFISDYSTVAEGWYIDDVMVPAIVGVEEGSHNLPNPVLFVQPMPNLFNGNLVIKFQGSNPGGTVHLGIYDTNGRLVKHWNYKGNQIDHQVVWPGIDDYGRQVNSGIYFIRISDGMRAATARVIKIK